MVPRSTRNTAVLCFNEPKPLVSFLPEDVARNPVHGKRLTYIKYFSAGRKVIKGTGEKAMIRLNFWGCKGEAD
jgi:hypothetical protein